MKVWSLMYVVGVQSVSIQYLNWNVISWFTRTTNSFVVAYVVKILNENVMLCNTLRNVLLSFNLHIDVHDWMCRDAILCTSVINVLINSCCSLVSAYPEISLSLILYAKHWSHLKHKYTWSFSHAHCVFKCSIKVTCKLYKTFADVNSGTCRLDTD